MQIRLYIFFIKFDNENIDIISFCTNNNKFILFIDKSNDLNMV